MQISTENVAKSRKFCTFIGNRGRRIERRCLNLHRKFINNHFCACAIQMLLKMAVNATICLTFEVQYGKSTSTRTTAISHLKHFNRSRDFAHAQKLIHLLTQGRALLSQITLIIFIIQPPKLHTEQAYRCRGFQKCNCFWPATHGSRDSAHALVEYFLGQLVKQTESRNMADIQNIKCKNQRKTSPNRWNFAL